MLTVGRDSFPWGAVLGPLPRLDEDLVASRVVLAVHACVLRRTAIDLLATGKKKHDLHRIRGLQTLPSHSPTGDPRLFGLNYKNCPRCPGPAWKWPSRRAR